MEQKQGTDINAVLKEITYLRAKADQLELNLVELLIKENKMIQSQYQMALQKLQENKKKEEFMKKFMLKGGGTLMERYNKKLKGK